MRVLWSSNAPWCGTGYGVQTGLICKGLLESGHTPHVLAYYGLRGGVVMYDGYEIWPGSDFEEWGNDVIRAHTENTKSDVVITLIDLFVLDEEIWSDLKKPWVAWVPIDHEDIGYVTAKRLAKVHYPVAMSDFGAREILKTGAEQVIRIYHAVDTDVYRPLDKAECRAEFNVDQEAYVLGLVMANKGDRKQFPLQLEAIKRWADQNPDREIKAFVHTDPTSKLGGWDMKSLVKTVGLEGKVYSTNQYFTSVIPLPPETMAKIYNCFDVLLNVSAGEGFGIPIVEAQACGIPVIAGNYTSMPELVHNGYCVDAAARFMAGHFGYQFIPDLEDLIYRIECVYRMADKESSLRGRQWVEENCSVPVIVNQWCQLLDYIEEGKTADEPKSSQVVPV